MSRKREKRSVPQQKPNDNPAQNHLALVSQAQFTGPIPPPAILEQYDRLVPGAAERILQMAEAESRHRQVLEKQAQQANIENARRELEIADYQSRAAFHSDLIGQVFGLLVSLTCIAGAIYLAAIEPWVAGALAAIPSAAVIQAFFVKRPSPLSGKKP